MAPEVTSFPVGTVVSVPKGQKAAAIRREKTKFPELSEAKIATRVGCDKAFVHRVLAEYLGKRSGDDLQNYKENKADAWDAVAMRALMFVTDAKLQKSSAAALMMVAGTAHDKAQVLRGMATSINVTMLIDAVNMVRAMRDKE